MLRVRHWYVLVCPCLPVHTFTLECGPGLSVDMCITDLGVCFLVGMSVCTGVRMCTCFTHWAGKVKVSRGSGRLRAH